MNSIAELRFPGKYVSEKWLKGLDGNFDEDLRRETVIAVKRLIETNLEVQVQDLIGSRHWVHNPNRNTYRNGYYERGLFTSLGHIAKINVPRIRDGGIDFRIFKKYQRRCRSVDKLLMNMFLSGVSTRRVEEVLEPLYGPKAVSAGLVSKVTKVLDEQVKRFHNKKLIDKYEYIILDAIYLNARSPIKKKRRCVLVAYGLWTIENRGKIKVKRELIDFQVAGHGESESAWNKFLNGLYYRGLKGERLKLIVTDGNEGLQNAINVVYPNALPQRCWFHKLQNLSKKLPKRLQVACIGGARDIYNAGSYNEAVMEYKRWIRRWRLAAPKTVKCLEENIEELLNFFKCPKEIWKKIRTTNIIERTFREVRRRTRPMSCFQNTASLERIIYAIFYRMNKKYGNDLNILEDTLFYEITQEY